MLCIAIAPSGQHFGNRKIVPGIKPQRGDINKKIDRQRFFLNFNSLSICGKPGKFYNKWLARWLSCDFGVEYEKNIFLVFMSKEFESVAPMGL